MIPHALIPRLTLVCVLFWGSSVGEQLKNQATPRHTDVLIVFPGAKGTNWVSLKGIDQVSYPLDVEYPASGIIASISNHLAKKGWQPLQDDVWNPGLPSSHVRGWTHFADATVYPPAAVDSWFAQGLLGRLAGELQGVKAEVRRNNDRNRSGIG
jgi:hypothetical protein